MTFGTVAALSNGTEPVWMTAARSFMIVSLCCRLTEDAASLGNFTKHDHCTGQHIGSDGACVGRRGFCTAAIRRDGWPRRNRAAQIEKDQSRCAVEGQTCRGRSNTHEYTSREVSNARQDATVVDV